MAETWRGLYPITSFVLQALERQDALDDSRHEQVLRCAAGFWSAAARGALPAYLGNQPRRALAEARRAFRMLGAVRTASLIRSSMDALGTGTNGLRAAGVLERLDDALARTEDNIDELIARYAGSEPQQELSASLS
ncbi:MAG: hypothetical protein RL684_989 [Pseudomonadota bacterium]|jgi:hypothetical protein